MTKDFPSRLTEYRTRHGLTADELGASLGCSGRYVYMLEAGSKKTTPNSPLYKLFLLLESGQMQPKRSHAVNEEPAVYRVSAKAKQERPGLNVADIAAQIRDDLEAMMSGSDDQKRRAFLFLRDSHLPMLASALNLDLD